MSEQMLEVSLLGLGTVLRLERNASVSYTHLTLPTKA